MLDRFGRNIDYVRISVTDLCNLRCQYCMPEKGVPHLSCDDILTYEQIEELCRCFASLGIGKIKITGGEPLVRKDIAVLIHKIKSIEGIKSVTLTTNGVLLAEKAKELKEAGIDGINISIDAVNPVLFKEITRFDKFYQASEGIKKAVDIGIPNIKINCVAMRNLNEDQLIPIAGFAKENDINVRFIEMMPIGLGKTFEMMSQQEVITKLEEYYGQLKPNLEKYGNGPAVYYTVNGFKGKIGFISAVSHKFCQDCNRVRLTSTGFLKTCLQYDIGEDLRPFLDKNVKEDELKEVIKRTIFEKPLAHRFDKEQNTKEFEQKNMWQIGG